MATTMTSPAARPRPMTDETARYVTVRANLLPPEIVDARRALVVRKQVLLGLVALAAVLIAWFGLSWWQTSSAQGDLDDRQRQATGLQTQQVRYAPLVHAQQQTDAIHARLRTLMVGDLPWQRVLATLRGQAPGGLDVTAVTGSLTTGLGSAGSPGTSAVTGQPDALNQTGEDSIGTLVVTGTASSKTAVAAYADRLAKVKGMTAPLIVNVAVTGHSVTFTVNVLMTSDMLGGRYAVPAGAATGATGATGVKKAGN